MSQSRTTFDQNWNAASLQGGLINKPMSMPEAQKSLYDYRVAWQSTPE